MFSQKVNILKLNDRSYPEPLKHIHQPPKRLFYVGAPPEQWLKLPRAAIVGSRKVSPYGRQVTSAIATELSRAGVAIISGMAFGVDSIAHQAALDSGGPTIAILPSSVEELYPASHRNLAQNIVNGGGCLISEYPRGTIGHRANFIARNRLVSGLADILIITEAALKSGSLHTARFALEQGKTVMAVPGNVTSPTSEGSNNLIKSGAIPVTSAPDVFFALKLPMGVKAARRVYRGKPEEEKLLKLISDGLCSQEELAIVSQLSGPAVISALTALELAGAIRPQGNGRWSAA